MAQDDAAGAPFAGIDGAASPKALVTNAQIEQALSSITDSLPPPTISRRTVYKGNLMDNLPPSLSSDDAKNAILGRVSVPVYPYNPALGPAAAPVTVVIFTDPGCLTCGQMQPQVTFLQKTFPQAVRIVHKFWPNNPYAVDNLAAFYGKIAQADGKFWPFLAAISKAKTTDEKTLNGLLLNIGVPLSTSQRMVRENARSIYRELDADTATGQRLGLSAPPIMFVDGIRMGGGIPVSSLADLVHFEVQAKHRNMAANTATQPSAGN